MDKAYLDHLDELRTRMMRAMLGIIIGVIISFVFISGIFRFLCRPYFDFMASNGIVNQNALLSLSPSDTFMMTFHAAILTGIGIALPWTIYQLWSFVAPGLYNDEKRYVSLGVTSTVLFFVAGALFAYFMIAPMTITFFYNYSIGLGVMPSWTINGYFGFITTLLVCFGVAFELPVVIFLLSAIGIVSPYLLTRYRRHAIIVIFIISALLTPPDVVTQVMMAIPLILLYEISIFGAKFIYKKRMNRLIASEFS
ncbi:MAG: twin-arginine translocase subunit TatC [Deltaproteobacteria bacterium CG11_big_fil_rev_8_21_14_0_20_49_13]|nr:MAG: twin-arginine translocase subunit TatC [Deltaproteobacteria bacterium CG11_big_fil_rev_8_21_14_0_20_49_13]